MSIDASTHLLDCNSEIIVKILDLRQRALESPHDVQKKALLLEADELQERLAENLLVLSRNDSLIQSTT